MENDVRLGRKDILDYLLDTLIEEWSCSWNYCLKELLPRWKKELSGVKETKINKVFTEEEWKSLKSEPAERERIFLTKIKDVTTVEEWNRLEEMLKDKYENRNDVRLNKEEILHRLRKHLDSLERPIPDFADRILSLLSGYPGLIFYKDFREEFDLCINKIQDQIKREIQKGNYAEAERIQGIYPQAMTQKELKELRILKEEEELKSEIEKLKLKLKQLFKEGKFEEAKKLFSEKSLFSQDEFINLKNQYLKEKIEGLLGDYNFIEADNSFFKTSPFSKEEYENLKSQYIKLYLDQNLEAKISISADKEGCLAIARMDKNLLLKARAGSGKTTTIAYKVFFLINKENVNPDDIMILAFNRKAAREIRERIIDSKRFGIRSFKNARTFHSLAYQIVQPKEELLFDERGDSSDPEFSTKKLTEYVDMIFKKLLGPILKFKLYLFLRQEMTEKSPRTMFASDKDYYLYIRNLRQTTLRGENVKSRGEKYIADFLFEHNLKYKYEQIFFWDKKNYRPDFTLFYKDKPKFIIEHWGMYIKRKNSYKNKWLGHIFYNFNLKKYFLEIKSKREFWKKKKIPLIETSLDDLEEGRKNFEDILKSKLERFSIKALKLSEKEIIQKIFTLRSFPRIIDMFVQFIQKAKKGKLTSDDIHRKIDSSKISFDKKTRIFLEIANDVYRKYTESLKKYNKIDFDDLLMRATEIIDEKRGRCEIIIDKENKKKINISNLKWIMIDEYQDFSKLFYDLIQKIKKYNKDVRLFCVGDDWQAINAFAGSNLDFFVNFKNFIDDSGIAYLLTNYRSRREIIENSNRLMIGLGKPSVGIKGGGKVEVFNINDVKISLKQNTDGKFIFRDSEGIIRDNSFMQAKYLKKCYEIIRNNVGKSVAILARKHSIYRANLGNFFDRLRKCFTKEELREIGDFNSKIKIGTAHSFKGLEADIIIILRACNGCFPLIHPDNQLFEIFGQTYKDVLDEERRLFYVAITRPEEKLYILTEESEEKSDFLKDLERA